MVDRLMPPDGLPCHAVHFYTDLGELRRTVGRFVADGILLDQPAIVLARPEVRDGVEQTLASLGVDVASEARNSRLILADAATTLESILVAGRVDVDRAKEVVEGLFKRLPEATIGAVRFYGEMAGILWRSGRYVEALELEDLPSAWNTRHWLMTLCSYSALDGVDPSSRDAICTFHSHLLSDAGQLESCHESHR